MKKVKIPFLLTSVAFTLATAILVYILQNYDLATFDDGTYNWLSRWWNPRFNPLMELITALGHTKVSFILTVLASLLLLYKKFYSHCFLMLASMGSAVVITYILKINIARVRPGEIAYMNIWGLFTNIVSYSFPSGHSVKALTFFGVLIYAIYKEMENKVIKRRLIALLCTITILIGVGQILLDRHFASDIVGGYLVAVGLLTFFIAFTDVVMDWFIVMKKLKVA